MKKKFEPPLHVAWEITRRCNAQCLHCSANAGPEAQHPQESTAKEALQIISQLAGTGVRVLAFSGGEPLLRPDLIQLIQHAVQLGLVTNLCTNGALLDEGMAVRLKESGLHSVTVSLDGACARTHDDLRCYPGLFNLAVGAIRMLVKHHHRVGVSFTPTTSNYREALEVVHLAQLLGCDSVCLSQYIPAGRGSRALMLNPTQLGKVARSVMKMQADYSKRIQIHCHDCHAALLLPPEQQEQCKGCAAAIATAGILADGTVTPCVFMSNPAGNLHTSSFQDIWQDSPALAVLRDRDQLKEGNCGACRFKLVCGGCRAAAMAIHGNPMAGDPSCWMFPESTASPTRVTAV